MGDRSRHWPLAIAIVAVALLGALLVVGAWLIFGGNPKWSRGDVLGSLAIAVGLGGWIGGMFGAPLFERWLARKDGTVDGTHIEVGPGATVGDKSIRAGDISGVRGPVVITGAGSQVHVGAPAEQPPPEQRAGQVVVGELPGVPQAFVKREAVERLAAVFAGGGGVAAISALTGGRSAGKTQVAAEYARRAVAEGAELVAWVTADDRSRLFAGLAEVAERLGVADPDGDSEASARRLREQLAVRTTPAVLVLDNANDAQLVRGYLPATGATRVIITSTDRAFTSLGRDVAVDVFERDQSVAYLAERTGIADKDGAAAVAKELGDLPLALAQAAPVIKLRGLTYDVYVDRLRSLPLAEMLPADRGGDYPHAVGSAILLSIEGSGHGCRPNGVDDESSCRHGTPSP